MQDDYNTEILSMDMNKSNGILSAIKRRKKKLKRRFTKMERRSVFTTFGRVVL